MGGFPRSGSTLLTALLNQHPKIYASENSPLRNMLAILDENINNMESWNSGYRQEGHVNCLKELGNSFYYDIEKPVIIDKNRTWGTPYTYRIAKHVNPNVKIVLTLRPILEILASFISLMNKNPNNNFDNDLKNTDFFAKYYRNLNDARCEYLMRAGGEIDMSLLAVANSLNYPENFHVVWYEDLVINTQQEMNKIYNFLNLEQHNNDLKNIIQVDKVNDLYAYGFKDLHTVKPIIEKSETNALDFLSDYIINKYANTLDFLK